MALEDLLAMMESRLTDPPETPGVAAGVSAGSTPVDACTHESPDTPPNEDGSAGPGYSWEELREVKVLPELGDIGTEESLQSDDDRRSCIDCQNLSFNGSCAVASPGGLVSAIRGYHPDAARLQRCAGYWPNPDDPDQRPGYERWPGL